MAPDPTPDVGAAGADPEKGKTTEQRAGATAPPTPPPAPSATTRTPQPLADEQEVQDTSGRPPLAEVATERAATARTRIVDTDEEEN